MILREKRAAMLTWWFLLTFLCFSNAMPVQMIDENLSSNSSDVDVDDLKRPDHLEGVKLERDGHLNTDFRKEVMLGRSGQKMAAANPVVLLETVFKLADKNGDKCLSEKELATWISSKVKEHLDQAIKENVYVFMALDVNRNGIVTWDEYHFKFMMEQGFNVSYANNHKENHKDLARNVREEILVDKAAFSEAARTNPEGLNIDEFLSFRHPEHSHVTLLNMVQDIFDRLDDNNDGTLSDEEFMSVSQDDMPTKRVKIPEAVWKVERQQEFTLYIDTNKDGRITPQELMMYADPRNPAHALTEARNLINMADSDGNSKLGWNEVLAHQELFLGSQMVDIAKKFHDEF